MPLGPSQGIRNSIGCLCIEQSCGAHARVSGDFPGPRFRRALHVHHPGAALRWAAYFGSLDPTLTRPTHRKRTLVGQNTGIISWPERAGISLEAESVRMVKSGVVQSRHRRQRSVRCASSDRAKSPAMMAYDAPVSAARTAHTNVTPAPRLARSEAYDGPRRVQRSSTYRPSASTATRANTRSTSAMGLERNAMPPQPPDLTKCRVQFHYGAIENAGDANPDEIWHQHPCSRLVDRPYQHNQRGD
jgi:hypothetical protein